MKRFLSKTAAAVMTACVLITGVAGCGGTKVTADTVAATLGETEITYGFVNFYAQLMQVYYDSYYVYMYGEDFWNTDVSESGDGSETMSDSVIESLKEEIEQVYRLNEHASDYGVELSSEDEAAIAEAAAQFVEDNTQGALETMGATEEIVAQYLELLTISNRVQEAIYDEANVEVTEEEAACRTFSYITIDLEGTYDDDGNYTEYSDDEIAAWTESGDALAAAAQASESGDYDTIMSDAGYTVDTYSYNEGDDGMAEEVLEAADALSEGEVSDPIVVDSDDEHAIYILRLDSEYDEEASAEKMEELIEEGEEEYFDEVYSGYQEESEYTTVDEVWAQISFKDLYETETNEDTTTDASSDASGDSSGDASADASSDAE